MHGFNLCFSVSPCYGVNLKDANDKIKLEVGALRALRILIAYIGLMYTLYCIYLII